MAIIDILGVPHAYELTAPTASSSPVLVFIHGWLLGRSYWQPLIESLSPDYQCLNYDLRGFGDSQSPKPKNQKTPSNLDLEFSEELYAADISTYSYTLAAYAADLGVLLQKLGIKTTATCLFYCWRTR